MLASIRFRPLRLRGQSWQTVASKLAFTLCRTMAINVKTRT